MKLDFSEREIERVTRKEGKEVRCGKRNEKHIKLFGGNIKLKII